MPHGPIVPAGMPSGEYRITWRGSTPTTPWLGGVIAMGISLYQPYRASGVAAAMYPSAQGEVTNPRFGSCSSVGRGLTGDRLNTFNWKLAGNVGTMSSGTLVCSAL